MGELIDLNKYRRKKQEKNIPNAEVICSDSLEELLRTLTEEESEAYVRILNGDLPYEDNPTDD
jgi:hypothetical protein